MSKKVLPNVLGIGVSRSGTSWIYEILKSHPDIYLPHHRKEIHFFDRWYKNGINWYIDFFPTSQDCKKYKYIGEVTPDYISDFNSLRRIKKELGNDLKFIVTLRNPVDRLLSDYHSAYQNGVRYTDSFEMFINNYNYAIFKGCYYNQLSEWFKYYNKDNFLILFFDELFEDPNKELRKISNFLNVDYNLFQLPQNKVNSSYIPKFHFIFKLGIKTNKYLVSKNYNYLAYLLQRVGQIFRKIGTSKRLKKLSMKEKKDIYETYYRQDIEKLEKLLKKNLRKWKY